MRVANATVLAFAVACSSSPDEPGGGPGAAGSSAGGGAGGVMQPSGGTTTGGKQVGGAGGGPSMAGAATGGSRAGTNAGGSSGVAGGGGSAGASIGGGGAAGCVENLACKLDPPPSTGDLQQDCVDRINQFLTQCACLPALKRRTDGEACANQMAKYDADQNSAHAGARDNICQPGGSQNSCPGYSSNQQVIGLCLQQMWDEGPPPTPDCTGDCYEKHGHFINMTDDSVTQVACGFYTTSS